MIVNPSSQTRPSVKFWLLAVASAVAQVATLAVPSAALDHISFLRDGRERAIAGQVLVEAQDGGLLVLDAAHVLWAVTAEELIARTNDDVPFEPFDHQAMAEMLLADLPPGFLTHKTAHYLICYNTSPAYAKWCGALFERLYRAFRNYWRNRGFQIDDPEWPLVALAFNSQQAYAAYARPELGEATSSVIGYFSLRTNRVTTYDLTGVDGVLPRRGLNSSSHINQILSRPGAERTVATIIHEATHQLAFNCGLQARYADIPLWVSEGVAIYFETPDLRSSRGWRTIGKVNRVRNADFRRYLRHRPADSLTTLLSSDGRFRNSRLAPDAYAEAWALNYFLIHRQPKKYQKYIRVLSRKKPLIYDEPSERLELFRQLFGEDLAKLDAEFLRYMRGVGNH